MLELSSRILLYIVIIRQVRGAAIGATLYAVLDLLSFGTGLLDLPFLASIPLASLGLGWVLPAALGGAAGALIRPKKQ